MVTILWLIQLLVELFIMAIVLVCNLTIAVYFLQQKISPYDSKHDHKGERRNLINTMAQWEIIDTYKTLG